MKFLHIKNGSSNFKEYNLRASFLVFSLILFISICSFLGYKVSDIIHKNNYVSQDNDGQKNKENEKINQLVEENSRLEKTLVDVNYLHEVMKDLQTKHNRLLDLIGAPEIHPDYFELGEGGKPSSMNNFSEDTKKKLNSIAHLKKLVKMQNINYSDAFIYIEENLDKISRIPFSYPVLFERCKVTSGYGERLHPTLKRMHNHDGDDFAPKAEHFTDSNKNGRYDQGEDFLDVNNNGKWDRENFWGTEVYATAKGTVKKSIKIPETYGHYIEIDHGDGIVTAYGHLRVRNVRKGQKVERGQKIGIMGSTGMSTSVHLHYEIKKNGKPVNPNQYYFNTATY